MKLKIAIGTVIALMMSAPAFAAPVEDVSPSDAIVEPTPSDSEPATVTDTVAPETEEPSVVLEDETSQTDSTDVPTDESGTTEPDGESGSPDPGDGSGTEAPGEQESPIEEDPFPTEKPENQAPVISGLTPITAISRSHVSIADLYAGVTVTDDQDLNLAPEISGWGGWNDAVECPNGYPCTYNILFSVTDSGGAYDDGIRTVTITGVPQEEPAPTEPEETQPEETQPAPISGGDSQPVPVETETPTEPSSPAGNEDLANTGASTGVLSALALGLVGSGLVLRSTAGRREAR